MTEAFASHLDKRTRRAERGGPLQVRARHHLHAVGAYRGRRPPGAELLRQQLSRARRIPKNCGRRPKPRSTATATAWPRCASSAAPRRSTSSWRRRIAGFLGMEDAILYSSCFDANGGLFETLLSEEDAVISDALNHASIIDGVRLSKARRFRYANNDMAELEARLKEAADARFRLIATDGVFSMDGIIAEPEGHLRPRRQIRRHGDGGRQPRRRLRRRARPRLARTLRRRGPRRHPHRHAGQGAGRRLGRLHGGQPRGGRLAAPALAALSVLQHADAGDRGRLAQGARHDRAWRRTAREAHRQCRALPRRHGEAGFHSSPAPDIRSSR